MTQTADPTTASALRAPHAGKPGEQPPRAVLDRWELLWPIGEGSLSQVFLARPAGAQGDRAACYAVKVLRESWQTDPRAVAMFHREAQIGQSISNSHLIAVLASRVDSAPYYLVMPWLAGAALSRQLRSAGTPPVTIALWYARQVAEALVALDQNGWRHADIKPSNIMVAPTGHVTLLDLGFARRKSEAGSSLEGCLVGTLAYVAPEAITSTLRADIRSDIYSLGATLYEMLTGQPPFAGNDSDRLARMHLSTPPREIRSITPTLDADVARLVHEMLAKDPLRRPQCPTELVERLISLEIDTFCQRGDDEQPV